MDKEVKDKTSTRLLILFFYCIAIFPAEELSQRLFHSDNVLLVILVSVVIYSALCVARHFITAIYYSHKKHGS